MCDVEGVRNLIGTGLVELAGGLLTAIFSDRPAFRTSASMTDFRAGNSIAFGASLQRAFKTVRPIFRERGKINAEVTGRLTETLGRRASYQGLSRGKTGSSGCSRPGHNACSTMFSDRSPTFR